MKAKKQISIELLLTEEESALVLAVLNCVVLKGPGKLAKGIIDALEGEGVNDSTVLVSCEGGEIEVT